MKATEMATKPPRTLSSESRGTLTGSGLDLETKIFSASGRGRTFFLTSLFIELSGSIPLQPVPSLGKFNLWQIVVAETPVFRQLGVPAKTKLLRLSNNLGI